MEEKSNIKKPQKEILQKEKLDELLTYTGSDESVKTQIVQIRHFFLFLLHQWSLVEKQLKGQELLVNKYIAKEEDNKKLRNQNYHLEISLRDSQDKIEMMVKQPKQPIHIFLERSVMRVLEEYITENKTLKDITSHGTGFKNGPQLLQELKSYQDLVKKLEGNLSLKDEEIRSLRSLIEFSEDSLPTNSLQSDLNDKRASIEQGDITSKKDRTIKKLQAKLMAELEHNSSLKLQCTNQASELAQQKSLTEYLHQFLIELIGSFRKDFDKIYAEGGRDFQTFIGDEIISNQDLVPLDSIVELHNASAPVCNLSQKQESAQASCVSQGNSNTIDIEELQKALEDITISNSSLEQELKEAAEKNLQKEETIALLQEAFDARNKPADTDLNQSIVNDLKRELEMKTSEQMNLIKSLNETSQTVDGLKKELDIVKRDYSESQAEVASWRTAVESYKADCESIERQNAAKEKEVQKLKMDVGNLQVKFDNYRENCTCRNTTAVADGGLFARGIAPASSLATTDGKLPSQSQFTTSQLVGSMPIPPAPAVYTQYSRPKQQQLPPEPWQNRMPWQQTGPLFQGTIAVRDRNDATRPRPQNFINRINEDNMQQQGAVGGIDQQVLEQDFWDTHTETMLSCEYCHSSFPSGILMDHIRECMKESQ